MLKIDAPMLYGMLRTVQEVICISHLYSFGNYVFMHPVYSGNILFLLKSLMELKTTYSLTTELKFFSLKEGDLDLKRWF